MADRSWSTGEDFNVCLNSIKITNPIVEKVGMPCQQQQRLSIKEQWRQQQQGRLQKYRCLQHQGLLHHKGRLQQQGLQHDENIKNKGTSTTVGRRQQQKRQQQQLLRDDSGGKNISIRVDTRQQRQTIVTSRVATSAGTLATAGISVADPGCHTFFCSHKFHKF